MERIQDTALFAQSAFSVNYPQTKDLRALDVE